MKVSFSNNINPFSYNSGNINFCGKHERKGQSNTPNSSDGVIITTPAQVSLFAMHDFHGQSIRMERAYSASKMFDDDELNVKKEHMDKRLKTDKLKLCSGDMFLGKDPKEIAVTNEFLNIAGVIANTIGNHECDSAIDRFAHEVKNRKYKLLSTNMHPKKKNKMNKVLTDYIICEVNGNKYGIIGISPVDMLEHSKNPDETKELRVCDFEHTIKEIQEDITRIKKQGTNKIILLSHAGYDTDKFIAQNVNDIDIILGGHSHTLLKELKEGENLFYSPKGEPVLIVQTGRDGEHIGLPNIRFNEFGQITGIDYNILDTDDFERSPVAKYRFEKILGKPKTVGRVSYVEDHPKDKYISENPTCSFILDCLRSELNTDIALMNSSSVRNKFYKGKVETRDLKAISPFANKVIVIEATEKELIKALKKRTKSTILSPEHKPGLIQTSGLSYCYDKKSGDLISVSIENKYGKSRVIDIDNPSDRIYTVAVDETCAKSEKNGLGLKNRADKPLQKFNCDVDTFVASYLMKQPEPTKVCTKNRIASV